MVEDLVSAVATLVASGQISPVVVLLLVVSGTLYLMLRAASSARDLEREQHIEQMVKSTELMTTLVEQLRTFSERQQEILSQVSIAGQNAAKNHETLARIETILKYVSKQP